MDVITSGLINSQLLEAESAKICLNISYLQIFLVTYTTLSQVFNLVSFVSNMGFFLNLEHFKNLFYNILIKTL